MVTFSCRLFDVSEKYLVEIAKRDPEFEEIFSVYFKLAIIYKKLKKLAQAILLIRQCLRINGISNSQVVEALCQMGNCLESSNRLHLGMEMYESAYQVEKNIRSISCLAWGYFSYRNYGRAYELFKEASRVVKNGTKESADIQYFLARCLFEMKSLDQARNCLMKLTASYTNDCFYLMSSAIMYLECGQSQNAISLLMICLDLSDNKAEIYFNLGIVYEHMCLRKEAVSAYEQVIEIQQGNKIAEKRILLLTKHKNKPRNIPSMLQPIIDITEIPF